MNSKTKVFLLPILTVALCACFAFGMFTMESRATTVSAEPALASTVYFYNQNGFNTPYAYLYNSDNDKNGGWPGVEMTPVEGKSGWYSASNAGNWGTVIFSDSGSNQIGDGTALDGEGKAYYWYGEWKSMATTEKTVYFYNDTWENVYVHTWNVDAGNSGRQFDDKAWAESVQVTTVSDHWYTVTFTIYDGFTKKVIFKDAQGDTDDKTDDLTLDGNYYANGQWFDEEPTIFNGELVEKTYTISYLRYYNTDDWGTVKVYSFLHKDGSGNLHAENPADRGVIIEDTTWDERPAMTHDGTTSWWSTTNTYNGYSGYTRYFVFTDATGENKTVDIAFDDYEKPYYAEGNWYHLTPTETPVGWLEENQIMRYRTAYFYNAAGWEHVYAYTWNIKEGQADIEDCAWGEEPEMTAATELGDGWFKTAYFNTYAAVGYTKGIMFKGAQGATDAKTGDLSYSQAKPYYVYGEDWFNAKPTETVLGWMTDATFDAIEKTDVTVYYYNANSNWATPYCFSFNTKSATNYDDTVGFPGTAMTEKSNGWYSYDMTMYEGYTKTFIFSNGEGNQTADLSYNADKPYYADGYWYADSAKAEMANNYYLEGTFGNDSEAYWSYATAIKGGAGTGTNVAEWHNVTLTAGTQFKALRGNNDGTTTWYTSMSTSGVNDRFEDNVRIFFDGVYNVYLNNEGKVYVNFAQEELLNATAKYKVSVDNAWLLIVAGLKLDALEKEGVTYTLGWTKLGSGEDHDTNTYYTSVSFKNSESRTSQDIMGEDFTALIVAEIAATNGVYQLYVKANGVRVAAVTVNVSRVA